MNGKNCPDGKAPCTCGRTSYTSGSSTQEVSNSFYQLIKAQGDAKFLNSIGKVYGHARKMSYTPLPLLSFNIA